MHVDRHAAHKSMTRLVALLTMPPGAAFLLALAWPKFATAIANFGSLVSGYAALIAATFALVKGSQELSDWKERRAHEKASDVAAAAIVATLRFSAALSRLGTFAAIAEDPLQGEEPYNRWLRNVYSTRMDAIREEVNAYRAAHLQAEAYLPADVVDALRELWRLYDALADGWQQFAVFAAAPDRAQTDLALEGKQNARAASEHIRTMTARTVTLLRAHTIGGET